MPLFHEIKRTPKPSFFHKERESPHGKLKGSQKAQLHNACTYFSLGVQRYVTGRQAGVSHPLENCPSASNLAKSSGEIGPGA